MFHTHFNSSNLLWSHKHFMEPQICCGATNILWSHKYSSYYDHTCIIPHIFELLLWSCVLHTFELICPDFHILSLLCNFFNWWICFCWMDWAWVSAGQKILFKSLLSSILPRFPLLDAAPPFFEQQSLIIPLPSLCAQLSVISQGHRSPPSSNTTHISFYDIFLIVSTTSARNTHPVQHPE